MSSERVVDAESVWFLGAILLKSYARGTYEAIPEFDAAPLGRLEQAFNVVAYLHTSEGDRPGDFEWPGLGLAVLPVLALTDEQAAVFDSFIDGRLDLTVDNLGEFVDLARAICTEPSR